MFWKFEEIEQSINLNHYSGRNNKSKYQDKTLSYVYTSSLDSLTIYIGRSFFK